MKSLNVSAMDTRDSKGRGRFFPFVPQDHIITGKVDKSYWYWKNLYYPVKSVSNKIFNTLSSSLRMIEVNYEIRQGIGLLL